MTVALRMSDLYAPTLKEDPAEAEIASHRLLLRAGMMRKNAAGIYSFLPLGWRALRKVEDVVREEMDAIGSQEMIMPVVQPAELWQQSGRWDVYGPELARLKDRQGRDFCLGPTHEGSSPRRCATSCVPTANCLSRSTRSTRSSAMRCGRGSGSCAAASSS